MPAQEWRTPKTRRTRAEARAFVEVLEREMPRCEWHLGGSWARGAPTVGDLDVMVVRDPPTFYGERRFAFPPSFRSQRGGPQIYMGDLAVGDERIHVDFWCVPPSARGAFKMFVTGPKDLNVAQRAWALRKGYNLSQLGLFVKDSKEQVDDGTEEDIYRILEMPWLSAEQRQAFVRASDTSGTVLVWDAPSDSTPQVYRVERRGDVWSCRPCKGFEFSRSAPKTCKHIKRAQDGKLGEPRLEQERESVV